MQFLFTVDITMGGLCSKNNDALDKSGSSVKKIEVRRKGQGVGGGNRDFWRDAVVSSDGNIP